MNIQQNNDAYLVAVAAAVVVVVVVSVDVWLGC
jgi:hypothetical protein